MQQNLPEVLVTFAGYKSSIQNCSKLTVSEYINDLVLFFRYIIVSRSGKDPAQAEMTTVSLAPLDYDLAGSVRTDEIYSYMLYLSQDRGNGVRIRARRLSAIKAFYKYHTVKSRRLLENPAKDIDSPNIKPALPKYLTLEESIALLESVPKDSPNYERDYCILTLFLNCGMRLAELVGINLSDIDADLSKLVVTGKGNKMRVVYLNSACKQALKDYLAVRQFNATKYGMPIKDKNALFLSSRRTRISRTMVQTLVYDYLKLAGLDGRGISVHKLRHTAATLMYNDGEGVDILSLQNILGHEQLTTTQIYTHLANKKLEEAVEMNPLAKLQKK
ncbi:MAG: tyrosine-type recombinase/integrase [Clostridia bacterium]|nr:tyrosine-type recombinase/integrase [Clostridia bacterium]MBR5277755.1 tyrosine-type recombinase/integrase [Clostridia bacterium]